MEFNLLEKKGDSLAVLHVSDCSIAFANALRRTIISQLPAFAIEEVDFYENNSPFYNELLANRLGLIPLTYADGIADDARISLTFNFQGPGTAYSKDIASGDEQVKPVNGNFPIAILGPKQVLRFEAWAVKSTPKKHAKFQSAHASYAHFPHFTVKKNAQKFTEFVKALPSSMLDAKGNVVAWKCDAVRDFAAYNQDVAEYKEKEDEFVFSIESYNNLSALQQLERALELMGENAKELKKLLK